MAFDLSDYSTTELRALLAYIPLEIAEREKAEAPYRTFRAAYEAAGGGRHFVRIHRVRERLYALGWSDEQFDHILEELRARMAIELHGGDPSQLTRDEIQASYSSHGNLSITLSWRE